MINVIHRTIKEEVRKHFFKGKAIIIYGPRQVGKTTLIEDILSDQQDDVAYLNGDEPDVRALLENTTSTQLKSIVGKKKVIFIDEAQRILNIGLCLKLITDKIKNVQVIASGSSSFELANQIQESLTGRKYEYTLLPFSFQELSTHYGILEEKRLLENRLIFGSYPEIVMKAGEEKELLGLLTDSYLYKDILTLEKIHKPILVEKIVKALALQIGSEVSNHELAKTVGSNQNTVEKYISILEKAFIVFQVPAFSRNIRNEIKKSKKIYFYDNGIRNAILRSYHPTSMRTDIGVLWENYLMSERKKILLFNQIEAKQYFWRTTAQQEIDSVEELNGKIFAYEYKWNPNSKVKFPITFTNEYSIEEMKLIHPKNYDIYLNPTIIDE